MRARMNPYAAAPEAIAALRALDSYVKGCGLEHSLLELVKIRASQINGCSYCLHIHTREARAAGETEERVHLIAAWRESPLYTPRERAALAWTEAMTLVAQSHAPEADYQAAKTQFDEAELVKLTLLIGTINLWNRIAIGFQLIHPVAAPAPTN
ncbi:carboxymuconolactone decarboxylase family protein [Oceanibaculum pacificum]|uniref:Alkylhydroperoxidase n=1 Tax=Oceanibaculum pacificum TaxID=580166 RepID=A0A154VYG8_9PROT|nr:carboxymuconolactone decarboxylase family protein [Oceanibaculum pacificum]KZD06346.1 alkylhydroperoxidase [Oceanibaculum pacificum]